LRNRIVAYTLAFCVAAVLSRPPRQVPALEPQQTGHLERIGGIPVAFVRGDPYQMGLQQGALLRSELRNLIRDYLYGRLIADYHASHFWLLYQARLLDHGIPASLRQEMHGIADGAGLSYQDVVLLNTVPDLQALTRKIPSWDLFPALFSSASQGVPPSRSSLCATFAGWGRATADGELLVGHNLDCAETDLLQRSLALTVRRPAKGDSFVALGLAGMVGVWTGMNEEQVIVALSSSPSADVAVRGQPLPLLLRQVLENSGSLTEAVDLLLSAKRLYGGNVMLGDGKVPQAAVLELSAHQHALFEGDAAGDLLLRTNHFLDTELALAQRLVLSAEELAASETRLQRLQHVLESNQGWIGTDKALAVLGSMDDVPSGGTEGVGTLQTILLNPARFTLWVAQRNASAATIASYVRLDLALELLGGR
jgi:hypothetical protein